MERVERPQRKAEKYFSDRINLKSSAKNCHFFVFLFFVNLRELFLMNKSLSNCLSMIMFMF